MDVRKLLSFLELTLKFRDVYRHIKIPGRVNTENDAEHSYQLALFAWYIAVGDNLPLDTEKIIRYALVHDLVEVYAGDVDAHTKDLQELENKPRKEHEARIRIRKEFPEFTELHEAMLEYENKTTEEARLVYAADKILSEMNVYLEGNTINVEMGLTIDKIRKVKDTKVAASPYIEKYWHEFIPLWEELQKKTMPESG
jgi:putative hydrolases of HD superfamily